MTEVNSTTTPPIDELVHDPADYEQPEAYTQRLALGLRPIFYAEGARHPDRSECPPWCGYVPIDGEHEVDHKEPMRKRHSTEPLETVASRYAGRRMRGDVSGTATATLETALAQWTNGPAFLTVHVRGWTRDREPMHREALCLSLDDAQELVTVLQHLIAQADAAEVLVNEALTDREHDAYRLGLERGAAGS